MLKPTIYYAHPMSYYGTKEEAADLAAIADRFPEFDVVNPGTAEWDARAKAAKAQGYTGMEPFLEAVAQANAIVYRTFSDGFISAGVAKEVFEAQLHGKPIYRVYNTPGTEPYVIKTGPIADGPILGIAETRDRIRNREI